MIIAKSKTNIIFMDSNEDDTWPVARQISVVTGEEWHVKGWNNSGLEEKKIDRLKRIIMYFIHGVGIFVRRKKYNNIVSWQQFYGIVYAWLCTLFHVKKTTKAYILTFIYKEKAGTKGRIYHSFVKRAISSKYVDKVIVYAANEPDYYANLFGMDSSKFRYVTLAYEAPWVDGTIPYTGEKEFLLSVGRSNRDYDFLLEAAKYINADIVVLCDGFDNNKVIPSNVHVFCNIAGDNYYRFLNRCKAVLIPLDNPDISSGQLVTIQAMQYGKPLVVTETKALDGYIVSGGNAIMVQKDCKKYAEVVNNLLEDDKLYEQMSSRSLLMYKEKFSNEAFGNSLGAIFKDGK